MVNEHALAGTDWSAELVRAHGPAELVGMIDEALIRQEAARIGLSASKEAVEARIQEAAAYLGSQHALEERLQELHMSKDELRQRAEVAVLLDDLAQRSIKIEDADVAKYYEAHVKEFRHGAMVRARMMLFATRANADALAEALKSGGDFAGLAKSLSEDPATAADGGDMGWFEANHYAPAISKVAFALQPGQTSPVFQGPDGWYIVRAEQKLPAGQDSLEKVHDRIVARIRQERLVEARGAWLKAKRQAARIAIKDRRLAPAVRKLLATEPPEPVLPGLMTPDRMMSSAPPDKLP
jgi:parvulin-like peptidyl-prolyl isomerase